MMSDVSAIVSRYSAVLYAWYVLLAARFMYFALLTTLLYHFGLSKVNMRPFFTVPVHSIHVDGLNVLHTL